MIKVIITAFVLVLLPLIHFSQTPKQVTIRPNVDPTIAFPLKEKYRFPEFRSGFLITIDDKKSLSLKFNFVSKRGLRFGTPRSPKSKEWSALNALNEIQF